MTAPDLQRFVEAQDPVFDRVRAELVAGEKRSHWMWFVFPQLRGLGSSPMSERYAIADVAQARRYLADPLLGARYRELVAILLGHRRSAVAIFGTVDAMKLGSSLALFHAAAEDAADRELFRRALAHFGYPPPA